MRQLADIIDLCAQTNDVRDGLMPFKVIKTPLKAYNGREKKDFGHEGLNTVINKLRGTYGPEHIKFDPKTPREYSRSTPSIATVPTNSRGRV